MDNVRGARRRGGRGRGRGVRTRGGRSHGAPPPPSDPPVEAPARGGRGGSGNRQLKRPNAMDKMNITVVQDLPEGFPLERALHLKRKRTWNPSSPSHHTDVLEDNAEVELYCVTYTGSPAEAQSPAKSKTYGKHRPKKRSPKKSEKFRLAEYGSEPENWSSDDDEGSQGSLIPSRILVAMMDTPMDPDVQETFDEDSHPAPVVPSNYSLGLYDFEWKSFPDPPIPPESRREKFCSSNVGPTTAFVNPYDCFIAIWDREIMEHIVRETNRYAQNLARTMLDNNNLQPTSRISQWQDTNVDELYLYFAIVLAMGVVAKSRLEEYWNGISDIFRTPGFGALMSLRRFQILSKCLHFNNNANIDAHELDASNAKLFKIQPILSHLNSKFQALYNLGQNIALDESLLQWKGLLSINQLIPNKAAKVGIKSYEICESQTGYLWRFEIHGLQKSSHTSNPAQDPMSASTPSIVLRLIQGLENKGHTLWMDNFYNSPALARRLKSIGFDCVGTLRTNQRFVPRALASLTKSEMKIGEITGFTSGDVDLMVWRDHNRVGTISTYHGNSVSTVNGTTKPILIADYNVVMGGVDKKDQLLAMYPVERKRTKIWYKKLFRRLLNVSVLNAYILTRHTSPSQHRSFRMSLIKALISNHSVKAIVLSPTSTLRNRFFEAKDHPLTEYPFLPGNKERRRRTCVVCKKRVTTYCAGCTKSVCMTKCFITIHQ